MTIPAYDNRREYAGDGTTNAWPFPVYFLSNSDIVVIRRDEDDTETTLTYGTHYSVTGAGDVNGGTVTPLIPTVVGATYVIFRSPPLTQATSFQNGSALPAATIIREFDKLTMITQRLQEQIDRTARVRETDAPTDPDGDFFAPLAAETASRIASDFALALMIEQGGSFQDLVDAGGVLPRNGSAPMIGNLPFGGYKGTGAANATASGDLVPLGQLITALMTREQEFPAENVTYLPMAPFSHSGGTPGISCKFGDGYITGNKVWRFTKPTLSILQSITVDGTSGGAGGGTSGPADGEPSTGPGGAGGSYTRKTFAVADFPAVAVFLSGRGGLAGGWDKTVVYPYGADTQGWITEVGAGGDGGPSAMLDEADWNGLGANDAARLAAFLALSESARIALCILYCAPGKAAPAIDVEENVEGEGGIAYGGDLNLPGNDGAGGAYWVASEIPYYPADGILGAGGACAGRPKNDGLWDTTYHGIGGVVGQLAGPGGTPKKSMGNHDGGWGSDAGGGGGGGQAGSPQSYGGYTRVIPGGMGGPGRWRVKCSYAV